VPIVTTAVSPAGISRETIGGHHDRVDGGFGPRTVRTLAVQRDLQAVRRGEGRADVQPDQAGWQRSHVLT
jgi:hypothetical protein